MSQNLEQKNKLAEWVKQATSGYKNVNVTNFTTSWEDGLAFCALAHHYGPDLIDFDSLDPSLKKENLELAFKTLQKLGVEPLLESNDILECPDELSIRTYLMSAQPILVSQHKETFTKPTLNRLRSASKPLEYARPELVPQMSRSGHKFSASSIPLFQDTGNPNAVKRFSRHDGLFSPASVVSEDVTPDLLYKVILIGDSSVGKTTLFGRWNNEKFMETSATVGVELGMKMYDCNGKVVKIQLWDTAGQELYRSITSSYYRGAVGAFLVYDITKKQTFDNIKLWLKDIKAANSNTENLQILLIGNKCDLDDSRTVSREEGLEFSKLNGLNFFETSARSGSQCQKAFQALFQDIHKIFQNSLVSPYFPSADKKPSAPGSSNVVLFPDNQKKESTCC